MKGVKRTACMRDLSNWRSTAQHYSNCIVQSNPINTDTKGAVGGPYYIVSGLNLGKIFPFPADLGRKQTVRNNEVSMLSGCP